MKLLFCEWNWLSQSLIFQCILGREIAHQFWHYSIWKPQYIRSDLVQHLHSNFPVTNSSAEGFPMRREESTQAELRHDAVTIHMYE